MWLYHRVQSPKGGGGIANSVDPDQTAPLGAVWSGSTLFAHACLSENLGTLQYDHSGSSSVYWDVLLIDMFYIQEPSYQCAAKIS